MPEYLPYWAEYIPPDLIPWLEGEPEFSYIFTDPVYRDALSRADPTTYGDDYWETLLYGAPRPKALIHEDFGGDEFAERVAALVVENMNRAPANKDWYTPEQFANLVGRKPWTIRQRCNEGRIEAKKLSSGEWMISHEELVRYQSERLLPARKR